MYNMVERLVVITEVFYSIYSKCINSDTTVQICGKWSAYILLKLVIIHLL